MYSDGVWNGNRDPVYAISPDGWHGRLVESLGQEAPMARKPQCVSSTKLAVAGQQPVGGHARLVSAVSVCSRGARFSQAREREKVGRKVVVG